MSQTTTLSSHPSPKMAFYLDPVYDPPFYSTANPSEETLLLASSLGLDSYISSANNTSQIPLSSVPRSFDTSNAPSSYPTYDPESPFNSPIVPVKSVGRDGRLKTKLMGVGTDGGFLTSPVVFGKSRMAEGAPNGNEIRVASPGPGNGDSYGEMGAGMGSGTEMGLGMDDSMNMGMGMGIGISGLSEMEMMGEYGESSTKSQGAGPKPRSRTTTNEALYAPYPDRPPTSGAARQRQPSTAGRPSSRSKFIEHQFPKSPPLQAGGPTTASTRKPKKNLTIKSLNKAKSCSALRQHPASSSLLEPLTPVSSHSHNFFGVPGVPYNSPVDANLPEPSIPFSFAELYNYGLAVDSIEEIDPRKSPYQFANELLSAENGDYGLLPTPYLAHGSGFTSPSNSYLSDSSPDLGLGYLSPGQLSSASMASGASMDMAYSQTLPPPLPQADGSRQPCVAYNSRRPLHDDSSHGLDPSLLSPPSLHQAGRHARVASSSYVASPAYSYPTRFAPEAGQHLGPYQPPTAAWTRQPPTINPSLSPRASEYNLPSSPQHPSLFGPLPSFQTHQSPRNPDDAFDRNLEQFDDIYEAYSQASTVHSTPKQKRGRGASDDEDDREEHEDDGSGEYVPGAMSPQHDGSTRKRLRTVASAPSLLLSPRRMRPGPKPRVIKSPQTDCESVFSPGMLSPPTKHSFHAASYGSPGNGGTSDDEGGSESGAVPKEVIQSLYLALPVFTKSGVKVPRRYECLMEGCGRSFPRKSAIESHIQTHLEDKPFVCFHAEW